MPRKFTYEYVKEYVESFGYKLLSQAYINSTEPLTYMCDKGHVYQTRFSSFKGGQRCGVCDDLRRGLPYDIVKQKIESDGKFKLISETYKNNATPLRIQCNCGHVFERTYDTFCRQLTCPKCAIDQMAKDRSFDYQEVKEYIESQGYQLLSTHYKNVATKIQVKCPEGHIYDVSYNNFRAGKRCRLCAYIANGAKRKFSLEEVRARIEKNEGFILISDTYENSYQPLKIQCPEGHIFALSMSKFLQGRRCTVCSKSRGETSISKFLCEHNVAFESEYIYADCRNIEPLRFDFAIFHTKIPNRPVLLIEYDGEFHYQPAGGLLNFKLQKKRDNIKNNYCQNNNIPLLRIPYWEFDNIEQILSDQLQKYNLLEK